jgi:hypothetical protein
MPAVVDAAGPEPLICAVLRHEPGLWDDRGDPAVVTRFIRAAGFHGVLPLLDEEFRIRADGGSWPKEVLMACLTAALARRNFEHAHRPEITHVLDALAAAGVRPLVLKGGALAHSHYPDPALRPRHDTDLLIAADERAQADRTLERLGYVQAPGVAGEFIMYQALWSRPDDSGGHHYLDVHWRLNNAQALAKVLAYPELAARSTPLPALGASARALAPVDALLLACVHRAGHAGETAQVGDIVRRGSDRLIWLYDIHLLAGRMSGAELDAFAELAVARQVKAICLDALQRSGACFGTTVPGGVLEALSREGPAEPSFDLFRAGRGHRLAGEFLAIPSWRNRMHWLSELAFPSADYMRWKYPGVAPRWLPFLYLRRACSALARHWSSQRERG